VRQLREVWQLVLHGVEAGVEVQRRKVRPVVVPVVLLLVAEIRTARARARALPCRCLGLVH
jgi:hypothetical protein